ncbi:chromosome partition protein Smc [bacterium BMS3Bbin08]|nr:chromosome partition protein Smc [bacterium BMS3Bbin08]
MKVQLRNLSLVGTSRKIAFSSGLNIISGPISTGKTSLLNLCRILLGSGVKGIPEEVKLIHGIAGTINLQNNEYDIFRTLSASDTSKVEIAGENITDILPALRRDIGYSETYGHWLLKNLRLPLLEVPSAPTKYESDPTPVSINDFFAYCDLPKEEIRSEVFGHRHPFKDIKRKYVFKILYGEYDIELEHKIRELRDVRNNLRSLNSDSKSFERLLSGTRWENRAALEKALTAAKSNKVRIVAKQKKLASTSSSSPKSRNLRMEIHSLDRKLADLTTDLNREGENINNLKRLVAQLENQHKRLTRSIVANLKLVDIEFQICPRCGASLEISRSDTDHCYVCLQTPKLTYDKKDLIAEQSRITSQILETRDLINERALRIEKIKDVIVKIENTRLKTGNELDIRLKTFISDSSSIIESLASERAKVIATIDQLEDYLTLFEKRDSVASSISKYSEKEKKLIADIDAAMVRHDDVESIIQKLEDEFSNILQEFNLPKFLGPKPRAEINRTTYMPLVNGRNFDSLLSEGLSVEVNIAHALAHQRLSLKYGIPLPNILFVDGISGAFGQKGYDPKRIASIYQYLIKISQEFENDLQIIVADNRVPSFAREFLSVEFTERNRLIPEKDLTKLKKANQ